MSRELHRRGFQESLYERPDRTWVCGHQRIGRPCPLGPDARGKCVTKGECSPLRRGDRWRCSRTTPFGGTCDAGPRPDGSCCHPIPPCQPERSLRAKRAQVTLWAVALSVGVLVLLIGSPGGRSFISPGPVGTQHGFIENQCERCHSAAVSGPAHWFSAALAAEPGLPQSERCKECHRLGDWSELAHGLSSGERSSRTQAASLRGGQAGSTPTFLYLASLGPGAPTDPDGAIACATCHKEHQGRDFELAALGNDQCQICHQQSFSSLSNGHPSFGDYPYPRRTRIAFNHETHKSKHFPQHFKEQEHKGFACIGCHQPEPTGHTMTVTPFAQSCGECHADDVSGEAYKTGDKGVPFLGLPRLDKKRLDDPEVLPLGEWPKRGQRKLSRFTNLLLLASEGLAPETLETVASIKKLNKLKKASVAEKNAVAEYAWASKLLLHDLLRGGQQALAARIERVTGKALDPEEVGALLGQIPSAVLLEAQENWLPHLAEEVAIYREVTAGLPLGAPLDAVMREALRKRLASEIPEAETESDALEPKNPEDWARRGGWYPYRGAISYRASGHADVFLRAWFSLSSALARPSDDGASLASAANALFQSLEKTQKCARCHSTDALEAGGFAVNWRPHEPHPADHPASQFKHQPHFSLGDEASCAACHAFKERELSAATEAFDAAYANPVAERHGMSDELRAMTGNFRPMEPALCADCHRSESAGDACVSCHNYHLGTWLPLYLTKSPREQPGSVTASVAAR